jgi:adenine phosphoribosyltransferase
MSDYYTVEIVGLKRNLPICRVDEKLSICAFNMFGDVELTIATATALLQKIPPFDVILTPEAKSIPLAYEMSRQSGKKYIVARKGAKVFLFCFISNFFFF